MNDTRLLLALAVGLSAASSLRLEAFPSTGANCAGCHTTTTSGRAEVVGYSSITNIGVRLDGKASVAQKLYGVQAGSTVTLSEDVLNGTGTWAVQLKGFDGKGLKNSQSNSLLWTAPSLAAQGWTSQASGTYFTTAVSQNTAPTFNFDLAVGAATPVDIYELTFVWVTKDGMANQPEAFYLSVIPEPSVYALAGFGALGLFAFRRFTGKKPARQ